MALLLVVEALLANEFQVLDHLRLDALALLALDGVGVVVAELVTFIAYAETGCFADLDMRAFTTPDFVEVLWSHRSKVIVLLLHLAHILIVDQ